VNPLDLRIAGVARGNRLGEQTAGAQARLDDFYTLRALGMADAPQVLTVEGVGDELQLMTFA
jgi:hypothetical protein